MGYRRTEVAPRCGGRLGSDAQAAGEVVTGPPDRRLARTLSSLLLTGLDHLEQHALTPGAEPVLKVKQPAHHDDIQRQDRQKTSRQIAD